MTLSRRKRDKIREPRHRARRALHGSLRDLALRRDRSHNGQYSVLDTIASVLFESTLTRLEHPPIGQSRVCTRVPTRCHVQRARGRDGGVHPHDRAFRVQGKFRAVTRDSRSLRHIYALVFVLL